MHDTDVLPSRHKLEVDAYYRMAEAGIIAPDARIELIDGELIDMAPIGAPHAGLVAGLAEALVLACAGRATVWTQSPIRLDCWNEPQPDHAVLRRRADFYGNALPGPADVLLIIEVADSSERFDCTVKLPLYARAGIGEVWIVDVRHRSLTAHRRPQGDGYGEVTTHHTGALLALALALAPEIVVRLELVFGGAQ